jgi:hypothetical protein
MLNLTTNHDRAGKVVSIAGNVFLKKIRVTSVRKIVVTSA